MSPFSMPGRRADHCRLKKHNLEASIDAINQLHTSLEPAMQARAQQTRKNRDGRLNRREENNLECLMQMAY